MFVYESIEDVLKAKSKSDYLNRLIKLTPVNIPNGDIYTHSYAINDIVIEGYNVYAVSDNTTILNIFRNSEKLLYPFFQGDAIRNLNTQEIFWFNYGDKNKLDKNADYIVSLPFTEGRYDINSSMTWNMSPSEKIKAKQLYKGKRNIEYSFFLLNNLNVNIAIIMSKSNKYATIVLEPRSNFKPNNFIKQNFDKIPEYSDFYLKGGWRRPQEIPEIIKNL